MANIAPMGLLAHGGALQKAMREFGGTSSDWLDLSTGINPNPPLVPEIPSAAFERLPEDDQYQATLNAARRFYGASGAGLLASGTQPIIAQFPALIAWQKVQILGPTYGEYARVLSQNDIAFDHAESLDQLTAPWCIIINPDNPSGHHIKAAQLLTLAKKCANHGGCLVVDEAFADVMHTENMVPETGMNGLLVLRSFGKFFGLAGTRLSCAFGSTEMIDRIQERIGPWPVSGPALAIGKALYEDTEYHDALMQSIRTMHGLTRSALEVFGFNIIGDGGLFLTVEHEQAYTIHDALKKAYVLTRVFDYQPSWIRFGLCKDKQDVNRLIQRLEALNQQLDI